MYFWLIQIIFNLQNCYMIAVMTMCLKKRFANASVWMYILVFEACMCIPAYYRFSLPIYSEKYAIVYYSMQIYLLLFCLLGYRDSIWKKLLWLVSYMCIASLFESSMNYIFENAFGVSLQYNWKCKEDLIFFIITNLVLFTFTIIPIMLWRKSLISISGRTRVILPLILMPVSQLAMFAYTMDTENRMIIYMPSAIYWVFALCFIADAVFVFFLIRQEEVSAVKLRLREIEHAWELEKIAYEDLQKREQELSKIRHDIKNQITVMYSLIEAGDVERADELRRELLSQIQ
ncbi:MAG: hypothetical protein IJW18_08620 [Lachnospiraceae bacterium]|nr:hypothetical protein [Lachnospiraceae bacterium]